METKPTTAEVVSRGTEIYRAKIRPKLTEADKGKYITIHTGTGEWEIADDYFDVFERARQRFGTGQPLFTLRAGHRGISFRAGGDTELAT